jgi:hypothetical protein
MEDALCAPEQGVVCIYRPVGPNWFHDSLGGVPLGNELIFVDIYTGAIDKA